jgi:tripartite-type tricarboxylate transporter receptor subunit TctC
MTTTTRRAVLAGLTAIAAIGLAAPSFAQTNFPTQPIRVIVPFPAGGTTDVVARVFGEHMTQTLGQPVVVENRGGGGGSVGADVVARADPDGHTLLFHNITFSATTTFMQHEGRALHDIDEDFDPVSIAVTVPIILLAPPDVPANNLEEFVEYVREMNEKGEPVFYGSTGPGSIFNLAGRVLEREAGIELDHVPFPGAAPLVADILAGRLQFGGDQLATSLDHVRSGRLKGMAVLAPERSPALPDVPTVGEMGFESLNLQGFNGFLAPAGTPREVIDRIREAVVAAASQPDIEERMVQMGAQISASTPEEFEEMLREQVAQMRPLVADP